MRGGGNVTTLHNTTNTVLIPFWHNTPRIPPTTPFHLSCLVISSEVLWKFLSCANLIDKVGEQFHLLLLYAENQKLKVLKLVGYGGILTDGAVNNKPVCLI